MSADLFALLARADALAALHAPSDWQLVRAVQLASACADAHELEACDPRGLTALAAVLAARNLPEVRRGCSRIR